MGVSTLVQSAKRHHKIASCIGEAVIVHLVQCVFFIIPTWLMWYYKGDGEEVTQCKKFDIRYGIFLVIFENTPKYTPEYYI